MWQAHSVPVALGLSTLEVTLSTAVAVVVAPLLCKLNNLYLVCICAFDLVG